MNKKIGAAVVAILGSITVAQAETINFAGTVSTTCVFSNNTAGVLNAYANGSQYYLASGSGPGAGSPASVDIAYTGSPTFAINAIGSVSSSASVPSLNSLTTGVTMGEGANQANAISAGATSFTSGTKSFALDNSASTDTATISMVAVASSPFPVGTYSGQTTVTCQ